MREKRQSRNPAGGKKANALGKPVTNAVYKMLE